MGFTYEFARPALSVDCAVFRGGEVLLIERGGEPFEGSWALPGGFLEVGEALVSGAARELHEETGLCGIDLREVGAFGAPDRDPREHVVSVAFWGEAEADADATAGDDARSVRWWALDSLPDLAFDHAAILAVALTKREMR